MLKPDPCRLVSYETRCLSQLRPVRSVKTRAFLKVWHQLREAPLLTPSVSTDRLMTITAPPLVQEVVITSFVF